MKIYQLNCDICDFTGSYPRAFDEHFHPEMEIGGVPLNIWTPVYQLPELKKIFNEKEHHGSRFSNCFPEINNFLSLGEGNTSLFRIKFENNGPKVYLKDEGQNPTGSFKDRGTPFLVASAKSSGKKIIAIPSTGNAAISLEKYSRKLELDTVVFVPETTSVKKLRCLEGRVILDKDLIQSYEHFFKFCRSNPEAYNGFPATNVFYYQGIKNISFEIFTQLGNRIPDWVVVPCGSGINLVSQYYGFNDLINLGLANKLPRFASVQINGADPITVGFNSERRDKLVILGDVAKSRAEAIASDTCFNFFKVMNILRKSNGVAVSVNDKDINTTYDNRDFPDLEYSSRSVYAALPKLNKYLNKSDTVVLIGTARAAGVVK